MNSSSSPLLDSSERESELRDRIQNKAGIRQFYLDIYEKYRLLIARSPQNGKVLELGSGGGFTRNVLPEIITSDVIPYSGIDRVIDATQLPFQTSELSAIVMTNVLHHLSQSELFFKEASRCLQPQGRILIIDQYPGWISKWIYQYFHHEDYDDQTQNWDFNSTGPLSGANGALAFLIFERDREKFKRLFPELEIARFEPHTALAYWVFGGLKRWTLLPGFFYGWIKKLDRFLCWISPRWSSFVDIELVKKEQSR